MDMYTTAVFKMNNQQGLTILAHRILNVVWQPGWEGSLREKAYMYNVRLSPFFVHPKLSQHCLLAILQHKMKSLKKKMTLSHLGSNSQ